MRLVELRERLLAEELTTTTLGDGSGVLVDLTGMTVLTFNSSGMLLLKELSGGAREFDALVDALVERFEVERVIASQDAEAFLKKLAAALGGV
ncbi:PqqD family protein [bacterium]|nr:PqqD family protein [bacterium]